MLHPAPVALVLLLASCASWDDTKRDVVTPFNALIHVDYPAAIQAKDAEALARCFAPGSRDLAEQDMATLFDAFDSIAKARCIIHDASPPDGDGAVRAQCVLHVDGRKNGRPFSWVQERVLTAAPGLGSADQGWGITDVTPGRTVSTGPTNTFVEEAEARGLTARNRSRGVTTRKGDRLPNLGSSGLAVGDVDGDGWEDLLQISGDQLRLYCNVNGSFQDITATSGIVTPPSGECRCGYFGDIDNDGDRDLFVGMLGTDNLLFENLGDGTFRRVPESESGLHSLGHTSSACLADFDHDGDLDLFVVSGNNMWVTTPNPPDADNAHPNQYFVNDGTGRFTEATEAAGLVDTRWGLACATSDYNRDGHLDLYVANDVGLDRLYRNRGDGTFEDVTEEAGLVFHGSSMSATFADVNGDGWPDIFASGMASNSRWLMRQPGFPLPTPWIVTTLFRPFVMDLMWEMFHGNRLYLNRGDGTFAEVSTETRTYWVGWAGSGIFFDFDNDTHVDIYTGNGFWTGENKHDC